MSTEKEDRQSQRPPSLPAADEAVETLIIPRVSDIGNFEVMRALPSRERKMVGPFIFWDQMGPGEFLTGQGVDVRPHPHINLATVTYLFEGSLDHKDSLGSDQRILPGDINLMTAGKGITHSERTGADIRQGESSLFGIQSWLALPKQVEEQDPSFKHIEKGALPIISDNGVTMRLIAGEAFGERSPTPTHSPTLYADIALKAGQSLEIPNLYAERALYPFQGRISIGGVPYNPSQMLILREGDVVTVKALEDVRMMLLGGAPMEGERYLWWNFVSSSMERIEQAKEDWKAGSFADVPNDEEFIPLP